ncbi:hypothetical protein [Halohasta litorea]|uniref:RING-type E3 ubiquitin transferase n=1 Tax=Halohasta litorea TaxID=869891 RepID=A0ABD6D6Q8_9EURY|nr:hypothetical protein [Halohasta litorea]
MWLAALGVVFVGLGVAMGWYGLRPLAVVPRLLRRGVQEPSTVSERSFVVCRGTATPGEEGPIAAPFTGRECLGFEFEVTERQPSVVGLPWFDSYLDDGVATTAFELDGSHGSLAVDPSPRRFSLDTEPTVTTVGPSETPSDRIQQFLEVRELPAVARWLAAIPFFGRRRFVERRIDPGEEYLIAGTVDHRAGRPTFTDDHVITDRSPWEFALGRLRTAVLPVVVAVVFVAMGSWALLA